MGKNCLINSRIREHSKLSIFLHKTVRCLYLIAVTKLAVKYKIRQRKVG
jgi:hypothetical protein